MIAQQMKLSAEEPGTTQTTAYDEGNECFW